MVEQLSIFGRPVDLTGKSGRSFRTRKLLLKAKLRTLLQLGGFSESENLLYCLAADDPFLQTVFFAPFGLSPGFIRQAQRAGKEDDRRKQQRIETLTLRDVLLHARVEAKGLSHEVISVEHLLLALLRHDLKTAGIVVEKGLTYGYVRQAAQKGLSSLFLELGMRRPKSYRGRVPG